MPWFAHAEDYYHTEVSFGMGWANAFEKDIFNVPQDQEISGVIAFNFAARLHLSRKFAVGLNLYGYYKKTSDFTLVDPGGGTTTTKFEFNSGNIGAQGAGDNKALSAYPKLVVARRRLGYHLG